ncbi:MAG: sensor histidine kinase [Carnobacterium sp.]|nr:sensor histidine kinase [Carnobacterium sp.]
MEKLRYKISSRATILLGRESVSKVESAIIELIKNSYDADASICFVYFDIENNNLYLIDNGMGMTRKIIEDYWMTIGTDNKKDEYMSPKGRIKSGEKGIGRFALDRLGVICELYSKNSIENTIRWKTNWNSFEEAGKLLDDIDAEFEFLSNELSSFIPPAILSSINDVEQRMKTNFNFQSGTIIKVTGLRDDWTESKVNNLKKSLEFLIPPLEQDSFTLCIQRGDNSKYDVVENSFSEDFDYKIESDFNGENFKIKLFRKEFETSRIPDDIFLIEAFKTFPYRREDFNKEYLTFEYKVSELLNSNNEELIHAVKKIGSFSFQFTFMKLTMQKKEEFYYREIGNNRKKYLDEHGGIKIYRDNFWVRPYGERASNSFDWLNLESRNNANPVAVSSDVGGWTVRNAQGQGSVFISRVKNTAILDKSSREGIIENDSFTLLKEIIIKIISILEKDRAYIAKQFKLYNNKINKKEIIKDKSIKLAKKITQNDSNTAVEVDTKDIQGLARAVKYLEEDKEELISELKLMRSLATNGLITTAVVHDLRTLNDLLVNRVSGLESVIKDNNQGLIERNLMDLRKSDMFMKSWVSVVLNHVRIDKRKRNTKDIGNTISEIIKSISPILEQKRIKLNFDNNIRIKKRIFVSDFESIFLNLIINSIESFERKSRAYREVTIIIEEGINEFSILYRDNGYGLDLSFKNPNEIFEYGISSKTNKEGEKIGTGLGMYILASTIREYDAKVEIVEFKNSFSLKMIFPKSKGEN